MGQQEFISRAIENDVETNSRGEVESISSDIESLFSDIKLKTGRSFENHKIADITVSTIEGSQAMINDFIILSTVRSNENGKVGFIQDERLINVALTRANKALFIIGSKPTLTAQDTSIWKTFIEYLDSKSSPRYTKDILSVNYIHKTSEELDFERELIKQKELERRRKPISRRTQNKFEKAKCIRAFKNT